MLKFLSLSSGSSGNCYYLGTDQHAILIDAGIPVRTIQKVLRENGLAFGKIMAVLVTHDHTEADGYQQHRLPLLHDGQGDEDKADPDHHQVLPAAVGKTGVLPELGEGFENVFH